MVVITHIGNMLVVSKVTNIYIDYSGNLDFCPIIKTYEV